MKQYSSTLSKVARVLVLALAITACETPEETAAPSDGGGGGTTTPVVGMDCGSNSSGGANLNATSSSSNVFFVDDIPGTEITSLKLYLKAVGCGAGTTCVTPMTLEVYACGDTSNIGNLVGTVSLSGQLKGFSQATTFTFSSPITIPTNCGAGQKAFAFHFTNNWSSNVQAEVLNTEPSTCYLDRGHSTTVPETFGVGNGGTAQYYRAVITATP